MILRKRIPRRLLNIHVETVRCLYNSFYRRTRTFRKYSNWLQSKARQKISSSNPQLNATLTDDQQGSFSSGKWVDDDEEPRISDAMNMPGNRNSMAETRPSSLSVPGLVSSGSGSRKVLDLMLFFSNSKVNASLLIRCIH